MTGHLNTKLKILSWDEKPYREFDNGRKFARAEVALESEDGATRGTLDSLLCYAADGTSTFVSLLHLDGSVDGRSGGVVLRGEGTFDGSSARFSCRVVPGSGTGDLTGATGTAESASTHEDYPYMPLTLRYELP